MRREFSRKTRAAAFERCGGRCKCTTLLVPGQFEYHHADGDNQNASLENCQPLCKTCHDLITHKEQAPRRAKMKRQRDFHIGAKTTRRPLPCGRRSKWKKKLDGTVVSRS